MPQTDSSTTYVWQLAGWPGLRYDGREVSKELVLARHAQGIVQGLLLATGLEQRLALIADSWAQEAVATAAIEGDMLDMLAVRSSIARRLGLAPPVGSARTSRSVDGLLDAMDDAVHNAAAPVTHGRLHGWQAALFPTGYAGMTAIKVGAYRAHDEPMQIVSGRMGREKVHYEAPPSHLVPTQMQALLDWIDTDAEPDNLVRAAIAHFWFEAIHPFEDGNGRVGRNLVDLLLARDAHQSYWAMGLSRRLLENRSDYYARLEAASRGGLDVTAWVTWFIAQFRSACEKATLTINRTLAKSRFWSTHAEKHLSARQRKALNVLLDAGPGGFEGGMSTKKFASIGATSVATGSRELGELVSMGLLVQEGSGRSTRYHLKEPE